MKVAVIGAGRVGTAVAVLLDRAGHAIVAVSGRAGTRSHVGTHLPAVPVVGPAEAGAAAGGVVLGPPRRSWW
jgi:predicted dinucleotide-binding enzyme